MFLNLQVALNKIQRKKSLHVKTEQRFHTVMYYKRVPLCMYKCINYVLTVSLIILGALHMAHLGQEFHNSKFGIFELLV